MILLKTSNSFQGIIKLWYLIAMSLVCIYSNGQSLTKCDCRGNPNEGESSYEEIGSIGSAHHKIQVCGYKREGVMYDDSSYSDPSWKYNLHSAIIIHDCKSGDTLFSQEEMMDASVYKISITKNEIILTEVTFINYTGFEYKDPPIPVTTRIFSLHNGKAIVSKPIPAFTIPPFSKVVSDSAERFYHRLDSILLVKKITGWIDYNQYPDDLLIVAALNNIGRSRELYRNLRKYFDLDGAISESYVSGYLDHLLDNIRKK
jgi:hypothetical protein